MRCKRFAPKLVHQNRLSFCRFQYPLNQGSHLTHVGMGNNASYRLSVHRFPKETVSLRAARIDRAKKNGGQRCACYMKLRGGYHEIAICSDRWPVAASWMASKIHTAVTTPRIFALENRTWPLRFRCWHFSSCKLGTGWTGTREMFVALKVTGGMGKIFGSTIWSILGCEAGSMCHGIMVPPATGHHRTGTEDNLLASWTKSNNRYFNFLQIKIRSCCRWFNRLSLPKEGMTMVWQWLYSSWKFHYIQLPVPLIPTNSHHTSWFWTFAFLHQRFEICLVVDGGHAASGVTEW